MRCTAPPKWPKLFQFGALNLAHSLTPNYVKKKLTCANVRMIIWWTSHAFWRPCYTWNWLYNDGNSGRLTPRTVLSKMPPVSKDDSKRYQVLGTERFFLSRLWPQGYFEFFNRCTHAIDASGRRTLHSAAANRRCRSVFQTNNYRWSSSPDVAAKIKNALPDCVVSASPVDTFQRGHQQKTFRLRRLLALMWVLIASATMKKIPDWLSTDYHLIYIVSSLYCLTPSHSTAQGVRLQRPAVSVH